MNRVCIIGISGKLGQYMAEHALACGYEVVGVCRSESVGKLARFGDRITGQLTGRRNLVGTGSTFIQAQFDWHLRPVRLGLRGGHDSVNGNFVGGSATTSLVKPPDSGGLVMSNRPLTNFGAALVRAYIDHDNDGDMIIDTADECPLVPGVEAFAGCPDTDEDGVAATKVIYADEALEQFRELSGFGGAVDGLTENPLPHLVVVRPRPNLAPQAIEALGTAISGRPGVDVVQMDTEWVSRFQGLLDTVRRGVALALFLFDLDDVEMTSRRALQRPLDLRGTFAVGHRELVQLVTVKMREFGAEWLTILFGVGLNGPVLAGLEGLDLCFAFAD